MSAAEVSVTVRRVAQPIIDELAERFAERQGSVDDYVDYMNRIPDAIIATLSHVQAPAEVVGEPVAWRYKDEGSGIWHYVEGYEPVRREHRQPLYFLKSEVGQ